MPDQRRKDANWSVADETGSLYSSIKDGATVALLMDIRDELKRMNNILHCPNFLAVPSKLERIARNTAKPRKRRRKAK